MGSSSFVLSSSAFRAGQEIPNKYTLYGENISPPLSWTGFPSATEEFALLCDDPDAHTPAPWVHWVVYKIPASVHQLEEGAAKTGKNFEQGLSSFKEEGYGGPKPPAGSGYHHYHFKIFALKKPLQLKSGLSKEDLLRAMKGQILAETELIGIFKRD